MNTSIKATAACNLDTNILQATLPLFEKSEIDAIEWSFDTLYQFNNIPDWFLNLIKVFSHGQCLIGHGVFFSLFSGKWNNEQQKWLDDLTSISKIYQFQHITEHFGFMTGSSFHRGAPLGIPLNNTTLEIGIDRLKRISNACQVPVGLENLAFSFSVDEVKKQGEFIEKLLSPINGFMILDLHNLYCQMHNFSFDLDAISSYFSLSLVREIHISGGSWEDNIQAPHKQVRRDTHDSSVPTEIFEMLKKIIPKCPNLKYVVLEQIGSALETTMAKQQFRKDFLTLKKIISQYELNPALVSNNFSPPPIELKDCPIESHELYEQQLLLSSILENIDDQEELINQLYFQKENLKDWNIDSWIPYMISTASEIARKWK